MFTVTIGEESVSTTDRKYAANLVETFMEFCDSGQTISVTYTPV